MQDLLSQQLDAADNEAVLQELQQLEDLALQEEMQHMPAVPKTEPQQAQQQTAQAAAAASTAAAEAAVPAEEELPSVPATKVGLAIRTGWLHLGLSISAVHAACVRVANGLTPFHPVPWHVWMLK